MQTEPIVLSEDQIAVIIREKMGWEDDDVKGFLQCARFTMERGSAIEKRTEPGKGKPVFIYVLGRASEYADSIVPAYGEISAGCGPNLREDFADCMWPVVIKVTPEVPEADLVQHLRDLADTIEQHPRTNTRPNGVPS